MSRIRTIKPEFWVSEQVVSLSLEARLLFIGLWNFSDDNGVHPVGYVKLKAEIFPCDNFGTEQIKKWVNELLNNNLLREYAVDEQMYWLITGWHKHQKIDRPNPKHPLPQSALKKISDDSLNTQRVITDNSTNAHRTFAESSPPEGKGKEGNRKDKDICEVETSPFSVFDSVVAGKLSQIQEVFEHWQKVMQHPRARLDKKRKKLIETAINDGYTAAELKQAIDGCSLTPFNMGVNDRNQCYDGIDLIFRDADHIDRFIENAANPPTSSKSGKDSQQNLMEGAL